MYAKGGGGIRIGLDKECIDWEKMPLKYYKKTEQIIGPPPKRGCSYASITYTPISIFGHLDTSKCYHPINYYKKSFNEHEIKIGANQTIVFKELIEKNFENYIGLYKDIKWAFQKEVRFRLFAAPTESTKDTLLFDEFRKIIAEKRSNPIKFIDLPMKESAFENIEITLGPNATESVGLIVNLLIKEYAPTAKIRGSSLNSETWDYL